jgi:hypothetical protein
MGEIVPFPQAPPEALAATCGCGGQAFILVTTPDGETPDFVYCTECQRRQTRLKWDWNDG